MDLSRGPEDKRIGREGRLFDEIKLQPTDLFRSAGCNGSGYFRRPVVNNVREWLPLSEYGFPHLTGFL